MLLPNAENRFLPNTMRKVKNGDLSRLSAINANIIKNIGPQNKNNKVNPIGNGSLTLKII